MFAQLWLLSIRKYARTRRGAEPRARAHTHAREDAPLATGNPAKTLAHICEPDLFLPCLTYVLRDYMHACTYSQTMNLPRREQGKLCVRPRLPGLHLTVPGLIKESVSPVRYVCSLSRLHKAGNSIENQR